MSAKRKECRFCGDSVLIETIERNEGFCEQCKIFKGYTDEEIAEACRQAEQEGEEDDLTPYPRTPPVRSFERLTPTGILLEPEKYRSFSREQPRYDSYDYNEQKNSPRWTDEEHFYDWLCEAQIPRELAEMLYAHAPEVSFLLGPGHIMGVKSIIEFNTLDQRTREVGFFHLASGPNGDFIVIRLEGPMAGEVCYLPMAMSWGETTEEAQTFAVPVSPSIGDFFETFADEGNCPLPRDYYDAEKRRKAGP